MSKKIPLSLSVASINELIKKIENLDNIVSPAVENAVRNTLDIAYEYIVNATPMDTGETASSTTYDITKNKATITQRGDHVFENEFGDGEYFGGYPDSNLVPSGMPVHDGAYTFIPDNPSSKYYHVRDNGRVAAVKAHGQEAHAQMYQGAVVIRDNLSKNIKKEVGDALSKI